VFNSRPVRYYVYTCIRCCIWPPKNRHLLFDN
jgi:hypothetical protein